MSETITTDSIPAPRAAKVSPRLLRRVEKSGMGTSTTIAVQRLTAFFGAPAVRQVADRDRERYRALCATFGLDAAAADADLALLDLAGAGGVLLPAASSDAPPTQTAMVPAALSGRYALAAVDGVAELIAQRDLEWRPQLIADDRIDPLPGDGAPKATDAETAGWLRQAGERASREAAATIAGAGDAAKRSADRRGRRTRNRIAPEASGPDAERHWHERLRDEGLAVQPGVLDRYIAWVRGRSGPTVSVAAALLFALGPEPAAVATQKEQVKYAGEWHRVNRLILFFGNFNYGGVVEQATERYRDVIAGISYARPKKDPKYYSYTTIQNDLLYLRRALRLFAQHCQIGWVPTVHVPVGRVVRSVFLTRWEVSRLLWATRGRIVDPLTDDWLMVWVPVKGRRVWHTKTARWRRLKEAYPGEKMKARKIDVYPKKHRRGLARAILIAVYSGTRHEAVVRMVWTPHASRGWIDVAAGEIHRYGIDESNSTSKSKAFPVSRLAPPLAVHARGWHKADARRPAPPAGGLRSKARRRPLREVKDAIIRTAKGYPYASRYLLAPFISIVEAAGLSPDIVMHSLRHTAATWHAIMGTDCRQAARLVGMSLDMMDRIYTHWVAKGHEAAVDIFRDPAARVRLRAIGRVGSGRDDRPRIDHAPPQQRPRRLYASGRLQRLLAQRAA